MSTDSSNRRGVPGDSLSLWLIFLLNLVVLIVLAVLLGHTIPSKCISPIGVGVSLALITLELLHLTWRFLGDSLPADLVIEMGPIKIPIGPLARPFDRLHPWSLSDLVLLAKAFTSFVIAGVLWFPALSPFSEPEPVPSIQNFLVHYTDSHVETYAIGSLLQIEKDTRVLVEVKISDHSGISCAWSTINGTLLPAGECATHYSTSIEGNRDTLAVLVKSPCKTYQTFAGLHIEVVENEP